MHCNRHPRRTFLPSVVQYISFGINRDRVLHPYKVRWRSLQLLSVQIPPVCNSTYFWCRWALHYWRWTSFSVYAQRGPIDSEWAVVFLRLRNLPLWTAEGRMILQRLVASSSQRSPLVSFCVLGLWGALPILEWTVFSRCLLKCDRVLDCSVVRATPRAFLHQKETLSLHVVFKQMTHF